MSKRQLLLLAVCVALVGPFIWSYLPGSVTEGKSFNDFVGLVGAILGLFAGFGAVTENDQRVQSRVVPFRLTPSFRGGLYGGIIGGTIAGVISGVAYYLTYQLGPAVGFRVIMEITVYGALLGTTLGGCCQFIILMFGYLVAEKQSLAFFFNEITGGLLGGLIAGAIAGILGAWYFYPQDRPAIDLPLIMLGTAIAPPFITAGALLYNYRGRLRNVVPTIIVWAVITTIVITTEMSVPGSLGIGDEDWWSTIGATRSGAILGSGFGATRGGDGVGPLSRSCLNSISCFSGSGKNNPRRSHTKPREQMNQFRFG